MMCEKGDAALLPKIKQQFTNLSKTINKSLAIETPSGAVLAKASPPLSILLCIDVLSAFCSAAMTSPFISIIDKAIFSNASGKESLGKSILHGLQTLIFKPHVFVRGPSFLWIWGVYGGTYSIANSVETICKHRETDYEIPKFIGSSIANVSLSLAKDSYFTRAFGTLVVAKPVPFTSLICYSTRDSSTILASFILPSYLSRVLQKEAGIPVKSADVSAQLFAPCSMQFLSTPLHLYGMDIYNHPSRSTNERLAFIRKEYLKTVGARIGRILPAFGFGGVINISLKKDLKKSYLDRK